MDKFLAMCLIIIQISNLFEFYKIRKEIKELKKEKQMYELLIKLYYELDYKKFTLEDLKEIKEILQEFNGKVEEVKLKRVKDSDSQWMKK